MEQKIFYTVLHSNFQWMEDTESGRSEPLNEKVVALNSQGWKVESIFCVDGTAWVGLLCTKIK